MIQNILTFIQQKGHETNFTLSDQQVHDLIQYRGVLDPLIRDDQIYGFFCHCLQHHIFTDDQFEFIFHELIKQLQMHQDQYDIENVILRSFTFLDLAAMIEMNDGYPLFSPSRIHQCVLLACQSLVHEPIAFGYHQTYGWIHIIAHDAEVLLRCCLHQSFDAQDCLWILEQIVTCFRQQKQVFHDGESGRLGLVCLAMIKRHTLSLSVFFEAFDMFRQQQNDSIDQYHAYLNVLEMLNMMNVLIHDEDFHQEVVKWNIQFAFE